MNKKKLLIERKKTNKGYLIFATLWFTVVVGLGNGLLMLSSLALTEITNWSLLTSFFIVNTLVITSAIIVFMALDDEFTQTKTEEIWVHEEE